MYVCNYGTEKQSSPRVGKSPPEHQSTCHRENQNQNQNQFIKHVNDNFIIS